MSKSINMQLIKYTGYYNQFGDILYCDQSSSYAAKINIAIGGYSGSGKSTLINTIFGEKRCLEGQGCSITNYISEYTLKNYALNFIDFPGFCAKQEGIDNISLFVNDIQKKNEEKKQINEIIHCFLFCIKYGVRIFDEKDKEIKNLFDTLLNLQIKTFFVVTCSEKSETFEFQRYKENIIKALKNIKKLYEKSINSFNNVFGENLETQIIPIFAMKKKEHGRIIEPFGLDELFNTLYIYFDKKKINLDGYDISNNNAMTDQIINQIIDKNDLLKFFISKENFIEGLKQKMETEAVQKILKYFLIAPKFFYQSPGQIMKNVISDIMESLINIYKFSIDNHSTFTNIVKKAFDGMNNEGKKLQNDEEFLKISNAKWPFILRFIAPIISPIYFLI